MHLVLAGGASSQIRDMQARGVINRDINQPAEMAGAHRYKTYRIYEKVLA